MMIEHAPYLDQLSPKYREAYYEFLNTLEKTKASCEYDLFMKYFKKYTLLSNVLSMWISKLEKQYKGYKEIKAIFHDLRFHLYTEELFEKLESIIQMKKMWFVSNTFDFPNMRYILASLDSFSFIYHSPWYDIGAICKFEELMLLPHSKLEELIKVYEKWSPNFMSPAFKKKYQNACHFYGKMVAAGDDDEKWVDLLLRVENEQFVWHKMNCRIGKNPVNKNLWEALIKFLEDKNIHFTKFFSTYSRYCRFFVDDGTIRQRYQDKLKRYCKEKFVDSWWNDLIEIEKEFGTNESFEEAVKNAEELSGHTFKSLNYYDSDPRCYREFTFESLKESKTRYQKNLPKFGIPDKWKQQTFYLNEIRHQPTCFPTDYVSYLLDNASPPILQRLQQSTKMFFIKQPKLICRTFAIVSSHDVSDNTFIGHSVFNLKNDLKNLSITDMFYARSVSINHLSLVKEWKLNRIICQNAKMLFSDLEILCKGNTILEADFTMTKIENQDDIYVENFISLFPDASIIKVPDDLKCSATTNEVLCSLIRNTKLKSFYLPMNINLEIDPIIFCKFMKNQAADGAQFTTYLHLNNKERCNHFKATVNDFLESWENVNKPSVTYLGWVTSR